VPAREGRGSRGPVVWKGVRGPTVLHVVVVVVVVLFFFFFFVSIICRLTS
jgi:hypothetical protein